MTGSLGKRSMTIGLIIGLVIGLGAGYGVVQAGYGVLQNELTQKNDQIQRLQNQISDLAIQIRSLNQSYQRLLSNYRSLNQSYQALQARYAALSQSYEKLLNDYRMLILIKRNVKETIPVQIDKDGPRDIYAKVISGIPPARITVLSEDGQVLRSMNFTDAAFGVRFPKGSHQIVLEYTGPSDQVKVEIGIVEPRII